MSELNLKPEPGLDLNTDPNPDCKPTPLTQSVSLNRIVTVKLTLILKLLMKQNQNIKLTLP